MNVLSPGCSLADESVADSVIAPPPRLTTTPIQAIQRPPEDYRQGHSLVQMLADNASPCSEGYCRRKEHHLIVLHCHCGSVVDTVISVDL